MGKRFYITTAIDYVNGAPHLGHAYEKVLADVIARARRSMGQGVFFLTGLDEHGQKVQQAAQTEGKDPQTYCDGLAVQWQELTKVLGLSNDDFVRTTQPRHREVVQAVLSRLHAEGHFYKEAYDGWYSVKEETFLTDKDRNADGTWDARWGNVVQLQEANWYFRMSRHQEWLVGYIEANPDFIYPDSRRNEVLGFLRSEKLGDLCISRPRARLSWGIPLPFDTDYVSYVWFDALLNYYSIPAAAGDPGAQVTGKIVSDSAPAPLLAWPVDVHLIGKDIVKFHAVYWPIMLHALGATLPKTILAHGWWQKDGQKMSKSTGNVVDPITVIAEWGLDAFRYYVVRELAIGPDGNWTDDSFKSRYNAELANGLGNLVNRSISMLNKYRGGVVPAQSNDLRTAAETARALVEVCLHDSFSSLPEEVSTTLGRGSQHPFISRLNPQLALTGIWRELVHRANLYVEEWKPFSLAKDPAQAGRLDDVLYNLVESCRVLAVLLWPFIPGTSEKIFAQLNLPGTPGDWQLAGWGRLQPGHRVGAPIPLFPRKDLVKK
jgi:methionyl-tRNA synthetase